MFAKTWSTSLRSCVVGPAAFSAIAMASHARAATYPRLKPAADLAARKKRNALTGKGERWEILTDGQFSAGGKRKHGLQRKY